MLFVFCGAYAMEGRKQSDGKDDKDSYILPLPHCSLKREQILEKHKGQQNTNNTHKELAQLLLMTQEQEWRPYHI